MMITGCRSFGDAIRNRRKALRYTQKDISEATGLSISFISDLERGKETIELGKALFLANLLGLDIVIHER